MRINATAEAKPGFHQNWIRMDVYEQRDSKPLFIVLSYWFGKKSRHVDSVEGKTADYYANGEKKKKKKKKKPTRKRDVAIILKGSTR